MRTYLLAVLTLTLIGCASSGPKIAQSDLNAVHKGQTTVAEVLARFGRPSVLSKNMDGTQTAAYMHVDGGSSATALVPLMGALAGKADADVDSVIFSFDSRGILTDYRTTEASAREPAAAPESQVNAEAGAATQASVGGAAVARPKAVQADKKAPARSSKAWTFQSWQPVGQVENR